MTVLTSKEVGEMLKLNERTVRRMAGKGQIPAKRVGYRVWLFTKEKIEEWLTGSKLPTVDPRRPHGNRI